MKQKNTSNKKDVVHIYYGSQGSGGIYLDDIFSTDLLK